MGRIELPIRKQPMPLSAQYCNADSSDSAFARQSRDNLCCRSAGFMRSKFVAVVVRNCNRLLDELAAQPEPQLRT